jgi:glucose-6-phosphate isomerase
MLPSIDFTTTKAYQLLIEKATEGYHRDIKNLFQVDKDRAKRFSIKEEALLFDFSKNAITSDILSLLVQLAQECKLEEARAALFSGSVINATEQRPVLHTALRSTHDSSLYVKDTNVTVAIQSVLQRMKVFSEQVINGEAKGFSGKAFTDVVNIGIGGSDLGPRMAYQALMPYKNHLNVHFVSNVDSADLYQVLASINLETTLFIVASKTFTTKETIANADTARQKVLEAGATANNWMQNFVGVSAQPENATTYGIASEHIFEFWNWVGGRFSVWSAVGLPLAIGLGFQHFEQFLRGAEKMDNHFLNQPLLQNIPVIQAMLGIWYANFHGTTTHAVLPYYNLLKFLPGYLQQVDMESNGKSTNREGKKIDYHTGSVIWGDVGTNSQHAFFQLLHQGTQLIPCDFIAAAQTHTGELLHQEMLIANCIAQSEALLQGRPEEDTPNNYQRFEGNKPSNTFFLQSITPYSLGQLLTCYEHKVFVQGIIWNIYSFDQWGVELGKTLTTAILSELEHNHINPSHDSSTQQLMQQYQAWK